MHKSSRDLSEKKPAVWQYFANLQFDWNFRCKKKKPFEQKKQKTVRIVIKIK